MKFLALGFCLLCTLLVSILLFRVVQHDTKKTETGSFGFFIASPKTLQQPSSGSAIALPAGTVVSVTLTDPIDSDRDPFGKQYDASVNVIDGQAIPPGSRASVVLANNNSGWLTQLTGLTVKGRNFQVLSSAGSVIRTEQGSQANSPSGILAQIGLAPAAAARPNPRVVLPSGTQLRFVLIGSATAARTVMANFRQRPVPRAGTSHGLSAAKVIAAPEQAEAAYLCRASYGVDRSAPSFYYLADVFKTSDNQALVERRWHEFLVATYPYLFAKKHHANAWCSRLADSDAYRSTRQKLEGELKSENAEIIETLWHYAVWPPPSPAASPVASTLLLPDPQ